MAENCDGGLFKKQDLTTRLSFQHASAVGSQHRFREWLTACHRTFLATIEDIALDSPDPPFTLRDTN